MSRRIIVPTVKQQPAPARIQDEAAVIEATEREIAEAKGDAQGVEYDLHLTLEANRELRVWHEKLLREMRSLTGRVEQGFAFDAPVAWRPEPEPPRPALQDEALERITARLEGERAAARARLQGATAMLRRVRAENTALEQFCEDLDERRLQPLRDELEEARNVRIARIVAAARRRWARGPRPDPSR
jgi:hypothetical protein